MADDFQSDIAAVNAIAAVSSILNIVCATTGMGFAAVARVTDERWIACATLDNLGFGLQPGGELKVDTTLCNEIRQHRLPVVIDNVSEDNAYHNHPTPRLYGLQSYISLPIILSDGSFFGTLCAIDPKPNVLNTPTVIGMFQLFAELIAVHLNAHDRLARSEARLAAEEEAARLREQFIAVLGHDLRNPLASIGGAARLLANEPQTDKSVRVIRMMEHSVTRMTGIIDNVMDLARGRLGGGFPITPKADAALQPILDLVIAELRTIWPGRSITAELNVAGTLHCDADRIAQLFSNLLGNALTHGNPDMPVRAAAHIGDGAFQLSVANGGDPIPEQALQFLFQPFFRADARPGQQGLGLGLFIASEIARAHGGTIDVASTPQETRFTFRMPLAARPSR